MFILFSSWGIVLWTLRHKAEQLSGKKDICYNTSLTEKEIGFYLLYKRSQILLFKGLMWPIMEDHELKLEWFFRLKPPGTLQISIFHRVLHLVTGNFYYKFDRLFAAVVCDLAVWLKYTCLNTEILVWIVELFIFDITSWRWFIKQLKYIKPILKKKKRMWLNICAVCLGWQEFQFSFCLNCFKNQCLCFRRTACKIEKENELNAELWNVLGTLNSHSTI